MKTLFTTLLVTTCLVACGTSNIQSNDYAPLAKLETETAGVWASNGYGYILDLGDGRQVYNVTSNFCVEITDGQENPLDYFDVFRIDEKTDELRLTSASEPYEIGFRKLETLPDRCKTGPENTILANYDAFTEFYAENYGFFDVYGVDWKGATQEMRQGISNESHGMEIVERFIGLLSQLKDGHVRISAVVDGDEGEFIANPGKTMRAVQEMEGIEGSPNAAFGKQYLRVDIEDKILGGNGLNVVNERIKYGITSGDIGYMAVMAEGGYTGDKDASFEEDLTALHIGMDEVISYFDAKGVKAVIIDLSVNHGGYDFLGRAIAGHFTKTKTLAYTKYAHDASGVGAKPYALYVEPAKGEIYTGPIYVLTSDATVSAGETLTLSLRALPNVTHAGEATRGAFSDVLTKYLPNGWEVTLSNEVYTDSDGMVWEGKGVKPQIDIPVFDPKNPLTGHYQAVEILIGHIDKQ